jgi:hypothetical protein
MNVKQALRRGAPKHVGRCICFQVKIDGVWKGGHRPSCAYYDGQQEARAHLVSLKVQEFPR